MTTAPCPQCSELAAFSKKRSQFYCSECEFVFDPPAAQIEPQTIFLSYAHQSEREEDYDISEELVWLIKEQLQKDGHKVWIDQEGISAGVQWRERITSAILGHTHFLSFLSKRSVRDPGVCLNEIAIALGSGRQIQTLLTESEEAVRQPLTISHLQWHQFADWKAIKVGQKNGPKGEDWEVWFGERMAQIRENLSDVQHQKVAGDLQRLKEILEPKTFESEIIKKIDGFFGRKWLFQACDQWLNNSTNRIFWLKGSPGIGKSSFAAKLVHQSNSVVVGFFKCDFQGNKSPEESASECIRTLAYQLAARLPDYRVKLLYLHLVNREKISKKTADDLFSYLITEPLNISGKIPEATRLALVIDALDEAGRNDGTNALADLIYKHADKLPPWLGVIVTSRPEPYLEQQLCKFDSTSIEGGTEQNLEDLRDYLDDKLDQSIAAPKRTASIDKIIKKSGGTFLYLKMIEKDKTLDLSKPETLPEGIDEIFTRDFRRYFPNPQVYGRETEPFLRLMAAAPGPLPVDLGRALLGWSSRDMTTRVTQPLGSLLQEKNGGLVFFHKSISDWLQDPKRSGLYQVNDTGAKELGEFLWKEFEKSGKTKWYSQVLDWLAPLLPSSIYWTDIYALELFAQFLVERLRYLSAIAIRRRILIISMDRFGKNSLEVIGGKFSLATILRSLSLIEEAKNILIESKDSLEVLGMSNTEEYASALDEIGINLKDLVQLDEALIIFKKALEVRKLQSDKSPIGIAGSLSKIAELYDAQGEFSKADESYRASLGTYLSSGMSLNGSTASLLNNYSILLMRMKGGLIFGPENPFVFPGDRFKNVKNYLNIALEITKKINISSSHPDNAIILNNLGVLSHNSGDFEVVQAAFVRAQEMLAESLGKTHYIYGTFLNNQAAFLVSSRQNSHISKKLLVNAIEIYEKSLGTRHPHVARCLNNFGVLEFLNENLDSAQKYLENGLSIYLKTLGELHCDTLQIQCNLATVIMAQGGFAEALEIYKDVYQKRIISLGQDHPQTCVSQILLGRILYQVGRYTESQQEYLIGIKNLSAWIDHRSKFMRLLALEYDKVCQNLEGSSLILFSEVNLFASDISSIKLIEDLSIVVRGNADDIYFRNKVGGIEELSTSYLRDQLEVLDIGLFELSVLNSFDVSKIDVNR